MQYLNLTPTWTGILGSWKRIIEDAVKVKKPDQMARFWPEMERMALGADRYSALVSFLKDSEGWTDEIIASAIKIGEGIEEEKRQTVHEAPARKGAE